MTFRVVFITSSDTSSFIDVEAKSEKDARRIARRKLGRECYRIIDVYKLYQP